jgi:hypothetical protein
MCGTAGLFSIYCRTLLLLYYGIKYTVKFPMGIW